MDSAVKRGDQAGRHNRILDTVSPVELNLDGNQLAVLPQWAETVAHAE
jgi:hypothetical protein